jgi:hypothetical protein
LTVLTGVGGAGVAVVAVGIGTTLDRLAGVVAAERCLGGALRIDRAAVFGTLVDALTGVTGIGGAGIAIVTVGKGATAILLDTGAGFGTAHLTIQAAGIATGEAADRAAFPSTIAAV